MMCQWRVISCNKGSTLVRGVDTGRGCACVGAGGRWEISVSTAQFCCEPKTALKTKTLVFKNILKKDHRKSVITQF